MATSLQVDSPAPAAPAVGEEWFPLAPNQLVIWYHELMNREAPSYNIGGYLRFDSAIDPERMRRAYQWMLERNECLRTEIRLGPDGQPRQRFVPELAVKVEVIDLRGDADPEAAAGLWMQETMDRRFHFDQPPYAAGALLLLSGTCSFLSLNCHHIISDGWSFSVMTREICRLYECLGDGRKAEEPAPSYRSYVEQELEYMQSPKRLQDIEFWKRKIPGAPAAVLPPRRQAAASEDIAGKVVTRIPRALYDGLASLDPDPKVSTFHVILAALHGALAGHRGGPEMIIGTPVLNRSGAARRRTIGLFAGFLPIVFTPEPGATFRECVRQLAAILREAYRHRRFPLSEINRSAGLVASGRAQLFDVTLSFERHDYETTMEGHSVGTVPLTNSVTPLPLGVFVREFNPHDDVQLDFIHRTDCLSPQEARWVADRVLQNLQLFLEDPDRVFGELPLLCDDERRKLTGWNETSRALAGGRSVVELIERWAAEDPDRVAVVDGSGVAHSRGSLRRQSDALAAELQDSRKDGGGIVGVCVERGVAQVVAQLAVLKAGKAFLPLSLTESDARLAGMLADAAVKTVIVSEASWHRTPFRDLDRLKVAEEWAAASRKPRVFRPQDDDPAYCMFTSGSTGRPKGVLLPREGLTNFALALNERTGLGGEDQVLQFAAPTFDASIYEVFCTLVAGATLHIPPPGIPLGPDSWLINFLSERRITQCFLTPAMLAVLPEADLPDLRVLIAGGDTVPGELVERWHKGRRVINGYGPAEATVMAVVGDCCVGESHPPIGTPLDNVRIHIVDENHRELPVGAAGEIAIGGVGVGLGYLNQPELNERAFVDMPGMGRVYLTGDLGRWRPDGRLEHLGRRDRQAKIRGCLVAPAEVEAALLSHPEIREAVVVPRGEAPNQWLAAYTVPPVRGDSLRQHLVARVPAFMIPNRFVGLDSLPLTRHGKTDLESLPPAEDRDDAGTIRNAPRDSVDQKLQELWAGVLGVQEPGIDDDFFALGGDSLKAAILGNEIEREMEVTLPMAMLIGQPTIRHVADALRQAARGEVVEWPIVLPIRPTGSEPPLFCLPGANASGFYLHALAQELPAGQPFYALQIPGVEPGGVPLETIEELADFQIGHLRKARPRGPYRLAGHSNGGIIAFEMTRRLEAAGERVESLTIFDTTLADADDPSPLDHFSEVADVGGLLDIFGWDRNLAETLPLDENGRLTDEPAVVEFVQRLLLENGMIPYNASPAQIARIVAVWRAAATAHADYRPAGPVDAPITLCVARTAPDDVVRREDRESGWGWGEWTKAGLRTELVPGNHVNMLLPPFVREVARTILPLRRP